MDDQEFLNKIKAKIESVTDAEIRLHLDKIDKNATRVDLDGPVPEITLGSDALKYAGFARMCIEYAVACIQQGRKLGMLEFHILLARN